MSPDVFPVRPSVKTCRSTYYLHRLPATNASFDIRWRHNGGTPAVDFCFVFSESPTLSIPFSSVFFFNPLVYYDRTEILDAQSVWRNRSNERLTTTTKSTSDGRRKRFVSTDSNKSEPAKTGLDSSSDRISHSRLRYRCLPETALWRGVGAIA